MADLRSALEDALNKAEDGSLEAPVEREIEVDDEPLRNEKGQFAAKEEAAPSEKEEPSEDAYADIEAAKETHVDEEEKEYAPSVARPTTWKKEFLPLWDKLDKGEALSQEEARSLLQYNVQRENEFKKGVSAYKAEADNSKSLREAIEPFVPELQKNGIHPAAWINNLGRAHMVLTQAPYEQKINMFNDLAKSYGIDLNLAYGGSGTTYQDPYAQQLQQQMYNLQQQVNQVGNWKQQQEDAVLMSEIDKFAADSENNPHFEALKGEMAQLLELGKAKDLRTAYDAAMWLVPEVREAELRKLTQNAKSQAQNQQRIAKAKAAAVSPKSAIPSGQVIATDKKDRRSILAEQVGDLGNRL